jgi:hypothetical protein
MRAKLQRSFGIAGWILAFAALLSSLFPTVRFCCCGSFALFCSATRAAASGAAPERSCCAAAADETLGGPTASGATRTCCGSEIGGRDTAIGVSPTPKLAPASAALTVLAASAPDFAASAFASVRRTRPARDPSSVDSSPTRLHTLRI